MPIRAVTFDYWDTLVRVDPTVLIRDLQIDAFRECLIDAGHPVDREQLVAAFDENWGRFEDAWAANRGPYTPADATDFIARRLDVPLLGDLRARLVATFTDAGTRVALEVAPGLRECLGALREAGLRLGIVCDVGLTSAPTLRHRLERLGMLGSFDAWAFSDETRWFKPAPEAFRPALEGLRVADPAEAAHIGDNPRTDIGGALSLGMRAIRFTGFADRRPADLPEADAVLADLRDVPSVLGLA